jgi:hypothetical protein
MGAIEAGVAVLMVEDELVERSLIVEVLEELGYRALLSNDVPDYGRFMAKPWIAEAMVRAIHVAAKPEHPSSTEPFRVSGLVPVESARLEPPTRRSARPPLHHSSARIPKGADLGRHPLSRYAAQPR